MFKAVSISVLALCLITLASAQSLQSPAEPAKPAPVERPSFVNATEEPMISEESPQSAASTADLVSLESRPPDPALLYNLGRYDEALEIYNGSANGNSRNVEAWYYRGNTLGQMGRYNESIESFDRVIELVPSFSGAWRLKGISLYHMERYDEAIYYFDRAIALGDNYARGDKKAALKKLGRSSEAGTIPARWDPTSGYLTSLPDMEVQGYLQEEGLL